MLQAQIYFDKDELHHSQPLQQFVMEFLIRKKVSGATAFKGSEGFGSNQHLNQPGLLFSFDELPMMVTFIDEDEKVKNTIIDFRKEYKGGLIITNKVDVW